MGVLIDDSKQPSTLQLSFLEKAQVTAYLWDQCLQSEH